MCGARCHVFNEAVPPTGWENPQSSGHVRMQPKAIMDSADGGGPWPLQQPLRNASLECSIRSSTMQCMSASPCDGMRAAGCPPALTQALSHLPGFGGEQRLASRLLAAAGSRPSLRTHQRMAVKNSTQVLTAMREKHRMGGLLLRLAAPAASQF